MNQRQKKKRMTKALKFLNQAEVIEFGCEGEDVLYIDIEDTPENVKLVTKACSILGLDKKKFIADCREKIAKMKELWIYQVVGLR
ncbi:TPA: hypothetical protein ACIZC1_002604 [Enterococcus faecalis]